MICFLISEILLNKTDTLINNVEENIPKLNVSRDDYIQLSKSGKNHLLDQFIDKYLNSKNVKQFYQIRENAQVALDTIFN